MHIPAETTDQHEEWYFQDGQAAETLERRVLYKEDFLNLIMSLDQANAMETIANQQNVRARGITTIQDRANMGDAVVVAKETLCKQKRPDWA